MEQRREVRDFLASRRARLSPEQMGLPSFGDRRRVRGLRREEVALLAGVSVDYFARLGRGQPAGASGRTGAGSHHLGDRHEILLRPPLDPADTGQRDEPTGQGLM